MQYMFQPINVTYTLMINDSTLFFYKQPVYKQLPFRWQIAKQLSGFKTISLNNKKN